MRTLQRRSVGVTIGNFDGMHRGHQALFRTLFEALAGRPEPFATLLTLAPHPRRRLSGLSAEELRSNPQYWHLTPPRRKIVLARDFGFDAVMLLRFSKFIRSLSPTAFVDEILLKCLSASVVVVGDDWRFGKGRGGDAEALRLLGKERGIEVRVASEVTLDGERVSSSRVRAALAQGELTQLQRLLGRRFGLAGRVRHGEKRGRALGYPTANLELHEQLLPPDGVYAGIASTRAAKYAAAISIGTRPMFHHAGVRLVEVYLLDTPWIDLYGEWLELEFVDFLRPQGVFDSISALTAQMAQDVEKVREILSRE